LDTETNDYLDFEMTDTGFRSHFDSMINGNSKQTAEANSLFLLHLNNSSTYNFI